MNEIKEDVAGSFMEQANADRSSDAENIISFDTAKKSLPTNKDAVKFVVDKSNLTSPIPLPDPLPKALPFESEMLPDSISNYVTDVSKRIQSPPDYIAVTIMCALASVVGTKVLMQPKQNDNWTIVPNLWGAIIGRPSSGKSPCMKEAFKPLYCLEEQFSNQHIIEKQEYETELQFDEVARNVNKEEAKRKYKKDGNRDAALAELKKTTISTKPIRQRLIVNDATVEKLGELLNENPNGLILVRDELSGWLAKMGKEEFQADRAFFLECFDGDSKFTYDRIGRGTIEISNCTLSLVGGIQPTRIAPLVRKAMSGELDDGLIQRLQLTVWPDESIHGWQDKSADETAYKKYEQTVLSLQNIGGKQILHFSPEAQLIFIDAFNYIHSCARSKETHDVMQSHLNKLPRTIASLALLFELISGGRQCNYHGYKVDRLPN